MSGKKLNIKATDPQKLRGTLSTVGMSGDIKSLIQEYHQDSSSIKPSTRVMLRKSSQKSTSISASITSFEKSKKVYDPYEMTSFEEGTPKIKSNIPKGAPKKIKLLTDSST
jgi:hypothetical protein